MKPIYILNDMIRYGMFKQLNYKSIFMRCQKTIYSVFKNYNLKKKALSSNLIPFSLYYF